MANIGLPWSVPTTGYTIQPVNGEFSAWSQGVNVPPDGWSVVSGRWALDMSQCQGTLGPYALDFGSTSGVASLTSEDIAILPATKYLLSAYYRISLGSGSANSQGVRVDWYDESRSLLQSTSLDLTANTSGTWTAQGLETTSPNSAVYARVVVGRFNVQGSTDFQLDSVKFDRKVYIPTGTVNLDDVTDGTTYARPKAAFMDAGRIKEVLRGAGTVATDFLFKKTNIADPDTIDGVPDGATYGRPKLDGLTSGYPNLDKVVDGATYARVKGTMLTAGEITSLSRGGSTYATTTFFQKALDSLDNVVDGVTYGRPKLDGLVSGYPSMDKVVDGTTYGRVKNTMLTNGEVTSLSRGGTTYATSTFFQKALDTLDNVANGTTYARVNASALSSGNPKTDSLVDGTYSKVAATYVDATSKAITTIRNTTLNVDVAGSAVFRKSTDTLDDVAEGTTYKRLLAGAVTSGYPSSVWRDGAALATSSLFKVGVNTLDDMAEGVTYKRLASGAVTSGYPSSVWRDGASLATSSLFKKSSDTFASVAGTLSDGQLGNNVVNTANIKDSNVTGGKVASQAIDWSKLDDGSPIMAWDEGRGSLLAGRVTYTNGGTLQTPEANQGYTSWAVTSGTTDFYAETDIQFRTIKDQFVSITYRTGGTTGWASSSTMRVFNMANVTQQATATMYGDGLWHTAVFDISAFTGTSTIRFDPQDGGAAIGAGATFWVSNVAVGSIGVGPGGGHTLVSYRGAVGINKAVPGVDLDINGGNSQNVWARLNGFSGIPLFATQRAAGTAAAPTIVTDGTETGRLDFRGYDGSTYRQTAYISSYVNGTPGASDMPGRLVFATTSDGAASATERMQITRDGVVAVNKPTAGGGAAIYINGTNTVYQSIVTTSGTVASFPQLQVVNYNANGGFPVTAHFNSKGTEASPAALSAGDTLGAVAFYGRGSAASYAGAEIKAFTSIAPATNISGLLTFSTASAAVSATERMRIDKDGRVSLGGSGNAAVDGSNSYLRTTGDIQVNQSSGILSNAYYAGGWKFAANGRATSLNFETGDFIFYSLGNNVSGGPGAAATATQRFRVYETGDAQVNNLSGVGNRTVYSTSTGILTNSGSDGTLKEDVQELENVLSVVEKMRPVSFQWKDKERFGPCVEVGFIAQEMLELVPYVVGKNADDTLTIDYPKLTAVLAGAIQELFGRVKQLEAAQA